MKIGLYIVAETSETSLHLFPFYNHSMLYLTRMQSSKELPHGKHTAQTRAMQTAVLAHSYKDKSTLKLTNQANIYTATYSVILHFFTSILK
jgi:hypothetical protein